MQSLKDLGLPGGKVGSGDNNFSEKKNAVHQQNIGQLVDELITTYVILQHGGPVTCLLLCGGREGHATSELSVLLDGYYRSISVLLFQNCYLDADETSIDEDKSNLGRLPAISYYVFLSVSATRVAPHDLT